MRVISATAAEAAAITAAEAAIFSDAWSERSVASHMEQETARTYVALEDGVLCGYLLGSLIPPEGEVYRVAVLPFARRRGIGDALLDRFLAECESCFLEVRKSNTAARTLYEKHGFSLIAERKRYYKAPEEDACIYRYDKRNDTV